ncbi:MAG: nitroreductase family protein [Burkholderiales bacterium]|nr:nitroreductase family protein [Burkholderiales bacterium]
MSLDKSAVTSVPIHDLMSRRWSPRAFDVTRQVTRAQLAALLEAARWAPSCNGVEPWRFLIFDRSYDDAGFWRAFECLTDANKRWVKNAPVLILSVASPDPLSGGRPNRYTQHDTGMASMCLVLQAVSLGLIAHQMAGYDVDSIRARFDIPEDCTPMAMIAVGYQADPEILDEEIRKKELASRERKPLIERFFETQWGRSVHL